MFAIVHQMRPRIMTSPVFTGERIVGAILFEITIDSDIEGKPTADSLWDVKRQAHILNQDALVHQAGERCIGGHRDPAVPGQEAKAEDLLNAAIMEELDALPVGQLVMLTLTGQA
jgi:hypothetical protein